MNTEALRKEIYEELRTQYESKLRDAKKQKSQLEEELESSSEKWRSERRRLNAEIDRLENALADNRDTRRKSGDAKAARSEALDISKVQAAAEEKLKKAAHEWESERTKLQSEISRLQRGVAELLERANNPMRAGQAAREQLEKKLEEAVKTRQQAEEALLTAKAEWDKEKLKLAGDAIKLRRSLGQTKGAVQEEDRTREKELEKQLADAVKKRQEQDAQIQKARAEVLQARDGQSAEIQRLTAQLNSIRDAAAREYADLTERERRDNALRRDAMDADLQKARARIQELESNVQKAREETVWAREAQAMESQRLAAQLESVRSAAAKEHAEQIERERRENTVSRQALENDLQKAKKEIDALKGAQSADQERQTAQLEESQKAHARIKELERRIAEVRDSAGKDVAVHVEQERRENVQAREGLERDLQKAQKEIALLKGTQSADLERQAGQLEESQKAHAKIKDLERRLAETKESAGKETASRLEKQLAESAGARQTLERELQKAQKEAAQQKEKHQEELRQMTTRLDESKAEIHQLERQFDKKKGAVTSEVVEQLRRQYDERIQEMIREKTALSEQLKNASALLEAERARFAAAAATQSKAEPAKAAPAGSTVDPEVLKAEFTRVEGRIAEIARLIDDPSSDLSLVIRKNVERAELDAYLKGILFSLGRSEGM
jgi:DNA repair exonuclease SbcCD ATPase subunit